MDSIISHELILTFAWIFYAALIISSHNLMTSRGTFFKSFICTLAITAGFMITVIPTHLLLLWLFSSGAFPGPTIAIAGTIVIIFAIIMTAIVNSYSRAISLRLAKSDSQEAEQQPEKEKTGIT